MLRQRRSNSKMANGADTSDTEDDEIITRRAKKSRYSLIKKLLAFVIIILFIVYVIAPFGFRYLVFIQRGIVFMNFFDVIGFKNLSKPQEDFGLNCTRVISFKVNDDITLGVWHILPKSHLQRCAQSNLDDSKAFQDNRPVILYLHGNGGARGGWHRSELYKVLAYGDLDSHVVTFDYRGYGDSSNVLPSAEGLAEDSLAVYNWLARIVGLKRIIVWGHSLGTAVGVRFVNRLTQQESPKALVLEAPFTSIEETVSNHPFARLHRNMPYFKWFFIEPLVNNPDLNFDSKSIIGKVKCPILILHALDDNIIPFELGKKLYEIALNERANFTKHTQLVTFNGSHGYGHKHICRDPKLGKIIQNFLQNVQSK